MFFSYSKIVTLFPSVNLVCRILVFEKHSFVINVEILVKNDIPLAATNPAGAILDIVNPLPTTDTYTTNTY